MKSKSLILMFVSLGFGLVAAIGISQVMGQKKTPAQPQIKMGTVLIAADFLDHNTELNDEKIKVEQWPLDIIPPNAATKVEDILNKAITTRYSKGSPIILEDLVDKTAVQRLPIPAGYKVVAIKVSADDTIYGLLAPGDRIDVIGVFHDRSNGVSTTTSRTFLKNIQVFSIDKSTRREAGPREATASKNNSILGVLVNQKQAEELVLAQKAAQLKIVLRGDADNDEEVEEAESIVAAPAATDNADQNADASNGFANLLANMLKNNDEDGAKSKSFTQTIWLGDQRVEVAFDGNRKLLSNREPESTTSFVTPPIPNAKGENSEWADFNDSEESDDSGDDDMESGDDQYSDQ